MSLKKTLTAAAILAALTASNGAHAGALSKLTGGLIAQEMISSVADTHPVQAISTRAANEILGQGDVRASGGITVINDIETGDIEAKRESVVDVGVTDISNTDARKIDINNDVDTKRIEAKQNSLVEIAKQSIHGVKAGEIDIDTTVVSGKVTSSGGAVVRIGATNLGR